MPIVALRNNKRHGRDAQIRRRFVAHELLEPFKQGTRPDSELGLTVRPRLVRCFGLDIDCNRSLPDVVGRGVIPALDGRGRERF